MPLHFFWGDEDYLIEKAVNKIKKDILGDNINELNYKSVDNPPFNLFSELLRTNAMMFGDSVIQIKCPKYFLDTKSKESLDDKQTQELINAISNISPNVHIILVCPTPRGEKKKPDSRKKLYKELQKITEPKEFPSYRNYEENKLIPIISKIAKEKGLDILNSEITLLIQATGTSLRDIDSQLEKIKLYAYPETKVTSDMINKFAFSSDDTLALADLVLKKDWASALNLISQILQKEYFTRSLAFIQQVFTNLLKIKLYSKNLSSFEIARKLNQMEFVVKLNLQKVKNVSLDDLINLKINLSEAEYRLKTGTIKDPLCAYEMAFLGGFDDK